MWKNYSETNTNEYNRLLLLGTEATNCNSDAINRVRVRALSYKTSKSHLTLVGQARRALGQRVDDLLLVRRQVHLQHGHQAVDVALQR